MKTALKSMAAAGALMATTAPAALAQEGMNIVFTHHSSASNTFWQSVQRGFDEACDRIGANCQMIFTQTEGAIDQQLANMEAALARSPDAILTSIVDDNAFDGILSRAVEQGITVIGVNVDDGEGAAGNPRQAFVGQSFRSAGYSLGEAMSENLSRS